MIFTVLLAIASGEDATWMDALALFAREAFGRAVFGLVSGYAALVLLWTIDDYSVEVRLTLTLVVAGDTAAELAHVSAPLGSVVAGLVIGNTPPCPRRRGPTSICSGRWSTRFSTRCCS